MQLRECFNHVLANYEKASIKKFAAHPLAYFIRNDLSAAVADATGEAGRLMFKGSAGQGTWAQGPWIGIFDPIVTSSAQSGYYPVYLFREDMQGVYLSLNQGMTEAKQLYKSDAKTSLRARAANFRAILGKQILSFPEVTIDLAPTSPSNATAFYEAGNVCAKYYPADHLPSEAQLVSDLVTMVQLYSALIEGETGSSTTNAAEGDEPPNMHFEDASKWRLHKRIERNASLSKKVKKLQGATCKICALKFEDLYGSIGVGFIEAHHLKPIASLKGKKVSMDPERDFAVLCSNCHRMVHRSGCVDNMQKFKKDHFRG